jgi:hypothetical protein
LRNWRRLDRGLAALRLRTAKALAWSVTREGIDQGAGKPAATMSPAMNTPRTAPPGTTRITIRIDDDVLDGAGAVEGSDLARSDVPTQDLLEDQTGLRQDLAPVEVAHHD